MAGMNEHVLKVRAELDTPMVVLRPGDKLIIGYSRRISMAEAATIKSRVAEMLPGVEATIIDGADCLAIYRPDDVREARKVAYGITHEEITAKAGQLGVTVDELLGGHG